MKERIAIIGPGRLGLALAGAVVHAGGRLVAIGARRARRGLPAPVTTDLAGVAAAADLVLITTGDAEITTVVDKIAQGPRLDCRTILHCSGILTSDVLRPLSRRGAAVGSLHPLQTFALPPASPAIFRETTFHFEGDTAARRVAARLARLLGSGLESIPARHKALYHAAAVFASNYQVALFEAALQLIRRCGMGREHGRRVLAPLAIHAIENIRAHDTKSALTGPIARRDIGTVQKHLTAIRRSEAGLLDLYCRLGLVVCRASRGGKGAASLREIEQLLRANLRSPRPRRAKATAPK